MHYLLIFKYFVIAYELMFDIITSGLLLPVKRNTSEFREPILYQAKFLNTLTGSNNTTIYYYGFPIQMVMSSANNDLFLSSFSIIFIHIYFLFYCLARISKTLLDSSKHSWLVSKFIKKKCLTSPLTMMLIKNFWQELFLDLSKSHVLGPVLSLQAQFFISVPNFEMSWNLKYLS